MRRATTSTFLYEERTLPNSGCAHDSDELRSWKFEWVDKDRLLGEFTNNEGETAFAWYGPEDTPLESLTK